MDFVKTHTAKPLEDYLVEVLGSSVSKNKKVLWLVPGGSNIEVVIRVMDRLKVIDLSGLTLMLSDERYGPIDHKDSNYFQLKKADLNLSKATFEPTLNDGHFEENLAYANHLAERLFKDADKIIAFLGMGSDGHIAGILPDSPAVNSSDLVAGYQAADFTRITLTPKAFLSGVHEVIIGAFGESKESQFKALRDEVLPINDQPAQLLKQIEKTVIFNDQIWGKFKT